MKYTRPSIDTAPFHVILQRRASRRVVLSGALRGAAGVAAAVAPKLASADARNMPHILKFTEIPKQYDAAHHNIAANHRADVVVRWGDPLLHGRAFDPSQVTEDEQQGRFGYNNDYIAFMPLERASNNSDHGLLCVNHEYTNRYLMFPGLTKDTQFIDRNDEQSRAEMMAHGLSVVEVRRGHAGWEYASDSRYNRRITAHTPISFSGPAAGHDDLCTSYDPKGTTARGTLGNCAGGTTPWGTVLTAEENFDHHFNGTASDGYAAHYARYDVGNSNYYHWHHIDRRFDLSKEPNEPNRFGWVVEYDPYDPESTPTKRTALGRFKHECATTTLTDAGHVVVYSGDDEIFEYVYRFVSRDRYEPDNYAHNATLLDHGVLSVARFDEDGTMRWIPLVHGNEGLTEKDGFASQAEILIYTRRAADQVGATPMDRPEDVQVNPVTGEVYIVMTQNKERETGNAANPRTHNIAGHIVTLQPPVGAFGGVKHAADVMTWDMFLRGGDPADASQNAYYKTMPSAHGWLTNPDNIAFDPAGNIWICTDGQSKTFGACEGLYAAACEGSQMGKTRLFFTGPVGAEITGPAFTPDGQTLFLSVQHPGEKSSFDAPSTRWPDHNPAMPPRPAIIAITKENGGIIGHV